MFPKARYRVVTDHYCGFEVRKWRWWFPFYIQLGDKSSGGISNTFPTIKRAKELIELDKNGLNVSNIIVVYEDTTKEIK